MTTPETSPEPCPGAGTAPSWHALTADEVLTTLESGPAGLTAAEAGDRLSRCGPNRLERAKPVSALRILVDQFASLVVLLLLAAALVALALGDVVESVAIAAVLLINTAIGFGVELRARRAMDALLSFDVPLARVVRGGEVAEIAADRLVPGDLIRIEAGDTVPADARVVSSTELRTDEASLTGESIPVDKDPAAVGADAVLAERSSIVHSGTPVARGVATAVVTATGSATELGRIGALVSSVEAGATPLERRLDALGRRLVGLTLATAGVVIGLGVVRGGDPMLMVETGIALAIAAVPEGLPAVATIALAVGLRRMARRMALVRRLVAVEALGATTVVCTDKTGTLTDGRMTATVVATADRIARVTGTGFSTDGSFVVEGSEVDPHTVAWLSDLIEACALTTRATLDPDEGIPVGDPTDAALLVLSLKAGTDPDDLAARHPLLAEEPFTSERRVSSSTHGSGAERRVLLKGAPDTLIAEATHQVTDHGPEALGPEGRRKLLARNAELAERGLRVIALAQRGPDPGATTLLGLVGIVDPPAPGVAETIRTLRAAGIRTVMITGDQSSTARAIAEEIGAVEESDEVIDGKLLQALPEAELAERSGRTGVFSRVSPEHKVRIVSALQERGEVVAMIGDGVNDAAALKKADIGVAMGGRGTDVAKQAASIVLSDDRFPTIGVAVEEGRVIYENIRKFVFYLFSCNVAEVLVLLGASIVGTPVPLLPLQLLWLNLVTDTFPALALALEPAEPGIMTRRPRDPRAPILTRRFLTAMGTYSALITAVTLGAYLWALEGGGGARATTVAFMTLALAQLFHLGNARSLGPVLAPRRVVANPWALAAVPLVLGLQVLASHWPPLSTLLGNTPLSPTDWVVVLALSAVPAVSGQAWKLLRREAPDPVGSAGR